MIQSKDTLSQVFVKGNDYGSEEWVKQLLLNVTSKKLDNVNAYAGVIRFPSDEFLDHQLNLYQSTQFQNSIYVGYMDFLLPDNTINQTSKCSYSKVEFNLDGVKRSFVKVQNGVALDGTGIKFQDFIALQFPTANNDLVFNRHGMHYLTDIKITGSDYTITSNGFTPQNNGVFTPNIEFEAFISGYKCLLL